MAGTTLPWMIDELRAVYGDPGALPTSDPFELILWENVAYLAPDERRAAAFEVLRARVGTTPAQILSAPDELLREIAAAGILPDQQAAKLRQCARVAVADLHADLSAACRLPPARARKALQRFPAIGEPGADKILLFSGSHLLFALESNGLRVLLRLGFGAEAKSYAATYRSVQEAVRDQVVMESEWLISAHQLLRRHGLEICRRTRPRCEVCPLAEVCERYSVDQHYRVVDDGHAAGACADVVTTGAGDSSATELREPTTVPRFVAANVTVLVSDFERALAFYTATLGLPVTARYGDEWAELQVPGLTIALHPAGRRGLGGNRQTNVAIGFQVERLEPALAALAARGVAFTMGGEDGGGPRLAHFADPDGTPLYLCELT
jgi:endonuclease III/catechol 2,3-dioxygenase-like lactoylglutathione lyase family enzyme